MERLRKHLSFSVCFLLGVTLFHDVKGKSVPSDFSSYSYFMLFFHCSLLYKLLHVLSPEGSLQITPQNVTSLVTLGAEQCLWDVGAGGELSAFVENFVKSRDTNLAKLKISTVIWYLWHLFHPDDIADHEQRINRCTYSDTWSASGL